MNLWPMFANTLSNKELTKIKVVDLDEFYNFYIDEFFSWDHLVFQNVVSSCSFLKFKIWIVQTKWNKKIEQTNSSKNTTNG